MRRLVLAFMVIVSCAAAHAADPGELHETAVAFDQAALQVNGKPAKLARWSRPIMLSIDTGLGAATRNYVRDTAASLVAETGVRLIVVDNGDLVVRRGEKCRATIDWDADGSLRHVVVTLAPDRALDRCAHHEILHALGLRDHPATPASVLSYHPLAVRQASSVDRLLLRTLYDPRVSPSLSIAEASRVARDVLAEALRTRVRAP